MDIDLNRVCGQDDAEKINEINLYHYFEDVYHANERISDDVGMRELSNDLDLNIEYVHSEVEGFYQIENKGVQFQVECERIDDTWGEGDVKNERDVEGEVDDIDDEHHELSFHNVKY